MKLVFSKKISSVSELKALAGEVSGLLTRGKSLGLIGELGAGKTTFSKELVCSLGSSEIVSSPTYVLQHEYPCEWGIIEHWDLYRLKSMPPELYDAQDVKNVRLIEWPDKFPELLTQLDFLLKIVVLGQNERLYELSAA